MSVPLPKTCVPKTRIMQTHDLYKAGAVQIGHIYRSEFMGYSEELDLAAPGFYFIALGGIVIHRSYVARQRTKTGFKSTLANIRNHRTVPAFDVAQMSNQITLSVHYVPYEKMKPLLNPEAGKVKLLFTKMYLDEFQNYEEVYQLLKDVWTFKTQPTRS